MKKLLCCLIILLCMGVSAWGLNLSTINEMGSKGYGPEILADGTCDSDSWSTTEVGWAYNATDDDYDVDGSQEGNAYIYKDTTGTDDNTPYLVVFEIKAISAGSCYVYFGGVIDTGTARSTADTFEEEILTTTGDNTFGLKCTSTFVGTVDNFSIKRVN